jgi:cellobiose phosphorylase
MPSPSPLGHWSADAHALPTYHYTGDLPFHAVNADGQALPSPPDPVFLLGNYRLTAFVHASGRLDLITGERAWGRLNRHGHGASLRVGPTTHALVGLDSPAAIAPDTRRSFGCGHARFDYPPAMLGGLACTRSLAVAPSPEVNRGVPALYLTVRLHNPGAAPLALDYREWVDAGYEMLLELRTPPERRPARYRPEFVPATGPSPASASLRFHAESADPLLFAPKGEPSRHDAHPPSLHLAADTLAPDIEASAFGESLPDDGHRLGLSFRLTLAPGETRVLRLLLGWHFPHRHEPAPSFATAPWADDPTREDFAPAWAALLPDFATVPDPELRREARWHVHALEALATYSEIYDETFLPQGCVYDFVFGTNAAPRDNLQHALAACHHRPALARSTIRHVLRRTSLYGEILYQDFGVGVTSNLLWKTSDQPLFLFLAIAEYLRVTRDHAFLAERVPCWPAAAAPDSTVLDHLRRIFVYLRDEVGVGPHGLLRILNSDWNDAIFHHDPINHHYWTAESHYNASFAPVALDALATALRAALAHPALAGHVSAATTLAEACARFARSQEDAFVRDLGERPFSRRAYLADDKVLGDDTLYLEPQIHALLLRSLPRERRLALWHLLRERLGAGEPLGLRQLDRPDTSPRAWSPGAHENGGVWYALNGPLIIALAELDREAAWDLFRRMSLAHHARACPGNWVGHWTAPDVINSSLSAFPGASSPHSPFKRLPAWCSHPHAWFLHALARLAEPTAPRA